MACPSKDPEELETPRSAFATWDVNDLDLDFTIGEVVPHYVDFAERFPGLGWYEWYWMTAVLDADRLTEWPEYADGNLVEEKRQERREMWIQYEQHPDQDYYGRNYHWNSKLDEKVLDDN